MEIRTDIAPVMLRRLDNVSGLSDHVVRMMAYHDVRTVMELVDWMDEPDQQGRTGKGKLRSLKHIGPGRASQAIEAVEAIGVDVSRPIPQRPWI